tara:strand:- start:216 stop:401 length:186 start_codon:yes stop_codon:yes gene_type:complete
MNKSKLRVIKDTSTVSGTLYKDDIVYVNSDYKNSYQNHEKIKVFDDMGRIWFVESCFLESV